jgi:hypothetical protein
LADTIGGGTTEYKFGTWPIYYAPKFLIGSGSAKGFVKGALGWQFSTFDRTSTLLQTEANDSGFLGGLGVGFMKIFNDKIFINAEYEWTYMSNSFYRDGFMNSIMGGIGIMF